LFRSELCWSWGIETVGSGEQLHQATAGILEVHAPTGEVVVDLARPLSVRVGPDRDAVLEQPGVGGVENLVADEEGVVLRRELGVIVDVVERDPIDGDRDEGPPGSADANVEDAGEELRRGVFVLGVDNGAVELDGQVEPPSRRKPRAVPTATWARSRRTSLSSAASTDRGGSP
jgi:hypothetical protein